MKLWIYALSALLCIACSSKAPITVTPQEKDSQPFLWENATIYFLLTDRFNNGDASNDHPVAKTESAVLRGYEGGDIKGITQKIKEGYFTDLGVNAIWLTPHVEQISGATDEGTGKTYAYHGYWAADWTQVDPNIGTMKDMQEFVDTAHKNGIRVLLDVVINHTGPVTSADPVWPKEWVRTDPKCEFASIKTTVECTLVENLPDIKTESDDDVALPSSLEKKWKEEGRYEAEMQELDTFFANTQLPRAPRYYLMKWHLDWVRELGVDGFRIDTAKHTEASIWAELNKLAQQEFETWKRNHPEKKMNDDPFYMMGEVYHYTIESGQQFNMSATEQVNFYQNGFDSLINFSLRSAAEQDYDTIFSRYSNILHGGALDKYSVVNYISSHDDAHPLDPSRSQPFESAIKLLLSPGASQIYYGDESARDLIYPGANGDANLRSYMNWDELNNNAKKNGYQVKEVWSHWSKLGQFRKAHPAVGAGIHKKLSDQPYVFSRTLSHKKLNDRVVVAIDLEKGKTQQTINVKGIFKDGTKLKDYYSNTYTRVLNGEALVNTSSTIVLLGEH
ncbi:alpha-amylase family glycosyl hydrolase [Agarilytica rhodophyticola]|uniref:alpha-amylase family glycosyl hydrolase n=1 Tax=Agarilytica rhodophyticola TaxID=1737490 RepID=UPI000B345647|nr:alpha-amylase family glycosyl hydrolase [Agarilytica rhodophyticola]